MYYLGHKLEHKFFDLYMDRQKKGFTLIELLVVIAIIALLLAIIIPAMDKVKEQGRMAICLSNHKNLLIAWKTYGVDNDDELVGGNTYSRSNGSPVPVSNVDWAKAPVRITPTGLVWDFGGASTPTPLEHELNGIRYGHLYQYLEDVDVYRCPSDNRKRLTGFAQPASFRSYSIVATMNGEPYGFTLPYTVKRETQIRIPSGKFVFMDDFDRRSFNMGSWIFVYDEGGDHRFYDPIGVWHFKKGNFSYADGHAEMRAWKDYRTHQFAEYCVFGYPEDAITNDEACIDNPDVLFLANGFKAKPR